MKGKFEIRNPSDRNPKKRVSNIRISNFGFKTFLFLFLLPFLLLSCSGIKSSWTNFRAHYNSYYNAENSFKAGVKKVKEQPVEVNPELPQRVHLKPAKVSAESFNNTIEKGADILRRFPESKWTDDALFLLGKSYYYTGDFFLAIEKFEELNQLTENSRFKQEALIWKARSLLDLEDHKEGIIFITANLDAAYLSKFYRAELKVLLGEHYAMQQNWEEAAQHLGGAIANLEESKLKGRTYFLYGQVLERLERFGEAFFAYDNVASRFPDYEYVYWSRMKKAEAARKEGNLQPAISIYTSMSRDDKNVSRLDRINYEISRTLEMQGDISRAEKGYKELLYSAKTTASGNVKAKTYYRLGKINSEYYDDFTTAAAYFDTASSQVDNINFLENKFDAERLSSAYGSYANLKERISRLDSLLRLGSLQPSELDSVLEKVREKKRQALSSKRQNAQGVGNRLTNISTNRSIPSGNNNDAVSSLYGFLNYKNPRLKREAENEFRAIWGNRPLVDNWRRIEVVRSSGIATEEVESDSAVSNLAITGDESDVALDINIDEIPTTRQQKKEYENDLVNATYQMGNLFFLTLNLPDSAKTYFNKIIRKYPDSQLAPRSMYSLFEINSESGNEQQLNYWGNRILREYPDSRFAEMVSVRMTGREKEIQNTTERNSQKLLTQFRNIESGSDSLSSMRAEQFRSLAIANRSAELAPYIHYRAIQAFVELAKSKTNNDLYNQFLSANLESDSSATSSGTIDSLSSDLYPFYGTHWDSVRRVITEYDTLFSEKPLGEDLKMLKKYLDSEVAPARSLTEAKASQPKPAPEKSIKACGDLGDNIEIVGGMNNFLKRVEYPSELSKNNASDEITYKVVISKDGRVSSSRLLTKQTLPRIQQAFDSAIQNYLYFDPLLIDGLSEEVSCTITFPLVPEAKKDMVFPVESSSSKPVEACSNLDPDMDIVGGMKNFLLTVEYPEAIKGKNISGEITFEVFIKEDGKVRANRMLSTTVDPSVKEAFEKAINKSLYFDAMSLNEKVKNRSCSMAFPVKK